MGEASVGADLGAGDAEGGIGDDGHDRPAFGFEENRFGDGVDGLGGGLFGDAGFLDEGEVGEGASVADGGLIGVHLDEGVIDAEASEGGEDMFDGLDFDAAVGDGGGAFDGFDVVDTGVDDGLIGEIGAAEFSSVIWGCGVEGEGDVFARVKGDAGEGGGALESMLELGHGRRSEEKWGIVGESGVEDKLGCLVKRRVTSDWTWVGEMAKSKWFGERRIETWGLAGAQTLGSVGPKRRRHGQLVAAARWEMPESWPMKRVARERMAARRGSSRSLARRQDG